MAVFGEVIDRHRNRYRSVLSSDTSLDPLRAHPSDSKLVRERVEKSHVTSIYTYLFATADLTQNTLALATNNISVCALFLKRIEYAVEVLETLVQENPFEYMTNNVVFNLCTLYDLSTTPEMGLTKKTVLHKVAAIYNVNDSTVPFQSYRFN